MSKTYDVSEAEKKLLIAQAKRRDWLREEFLKEKHNPFKHATGESGHVFDQGLQRFIALKFTTYDQFTPSPKSGISLFFILCPILGYACFLKYLRDREECRFRTGQVAYIDRMFKFK